MSTNGRISPRYSNQLTRKQIEEALRESENRYRRVYVMVRQAHHERGVPTPLNYTLIYVKKKFTDRGMREWFQNPDTLFSCDNTHYHLRIIRKRPR